MKTKSLTTDNYKYLTNFMMFVFILSLILLQGCARNGNDNLPANMEEIHRIQGVPVVVQTVEHSEFLKEYEYQMTVNGIREARINSRIGDMIIDINARIGQNVSQDQIIIQFPQDNPQANYLQSKAAFELAQQTLQRMQVLFQSGGVSQQELDGADTQFKVAEANWNAVQQAVYVRSPISGQITDINVRVGERVNMNDYLFTVSQLNRLHGRIWISPNDIGAISQNARVSFTWNGITKHGRVTSISMSLNPQFNAFAADVEIENNDLAIKGGVTGAANIVIYSNESSIVVPRNIVQFDADGQSYVFLAQNGRAVRRNVTIGNESELNFQISEGLEIGEQLIIRGLQLVRDAININIQ